MEDHPDSTTGFTISDGKSSLVGGACLIVGGDSISKEIAAAMKATGNAYRVCTAASLADISKVVQLNQPNLIILEMLPAEEELTALHAAASGIPIFFIAPAADGSTREKGFSMGLDETISLPLSPGEMAVRIRSQLEMRDAEKTIEILARENEQLRKELNQHIHWFSMIAENIEEIFFLVSADNQKILYANPACGMASGRKVEELYANAYAWVDAVVSSEWMQLERNPEEKEKRREMHISRPDGESRWLWLRYKPVFDEQGNLIFKIGTGFDITRQREEMLQKLDAQRIAEARAEELQIAIRREQQLNEISRAITSQLDLQKALATVIDLAVDLLEASSGSIGIFTPDASSVELIYHPSTPEEVRKVNQIKREPGNPIWDILITHESLLTDDYQSSPIALPNLKAAGVHSAIRVPILFGDTCLGAISIYQFNPQKKFTPRDLALAESIGRQAGVAINNARLFEETQRLAITDPLTQISNRRHFYEQARKEVIRLQRYGGSLSIMMMDIDHFKEVNDQYSHTVGDNVLCRVADICAKSLRLTDLLARYGGEEFVILLPETGPQEAYRTARRLCKQVSSNPFEIEDARIPVTVSLGVSAITSLGSSRPEEDVEAVINRLIDQADRALYQSKEAGRDQVTIWLEEDDE